MKKNEYGNDSLHLSIDNNNMEMVKLLMEYANQHHIILNINEKNENGWSPLLNSSNINNAEIVKLLMEYADEHDIILDINEKK